MYHKWKTYDVWFWDIRHDRQFFFVILGHFLPFCHPDNQENQNFEKMKTNPGDTHVHRKWRSYDAWFLRNKVQRIGFFITQDHFFLFFPPNNMENQNLEKMKKIPGDLILKMCTINDNHNMMYRYWDMEYNGQNFLSFWAFFIFLPLNNLEHQKFEKMKKYNWRYYHITHVCHIWCMVPEILVQQNFLSFWVTFCDFTNLTTRKIKILKKWKQILDIISFYTCVL